MIQRFLVTLLAALSLAPGVALAPRAQDVATLVAELERDADRSDPAKIQALAALHTREAMNGLKQVYDSMASGLMRLEVLRGLATFDGVADSQQAALQKIADVATADPEPDLRKAAIDLLGGCKSLGKHFLELIVDSPAENELRERAMKWHVQIGDDSDLGWYAKKFELPEKDREAKEKKPKKGEKSGASEDDADKVLKVNWLPKVRELAFTKLAPTFDAQRLVELARDKERNVSNVMSVDDVRKDGVRRIALEELLRRNDRRARDAAEEAYKDKGELPAIRVLGARILAQHDGPKAVARFIDDGQGDDSVMPLELRDALADLVSEHGDDGDFKKLVKLIGKGQTSSQFFVLRAVRRVQDPKVGKAIGKLLAEEEKLDERGRPATPEERNKQRMKLVAVEILGERGDASALPDLETFFLAANDDETATTCLDAISRIRASDPAWTQKLFEYVADKRQEIRAAAIAHLGKLGGQENEAVLIQALEDPSWSVRLAALRGLELARNADAVAAIIARMGKEDGRLLHECGDTLQRLTGLPFDISVSAWKTWWEKQEGKFTPISAEELAQVKQREELRWLSQTTKVERPPARFFGVTVVSKRTIFILDISGSMKFEMQSKVEGEKGPLRIDVAKNELTRCIEQLSDDSLFNLVVFSTGVSWWLEGGVAESKAKSKSDAVAFIAKLEADGGTNLYGSLREAFSDPDVDTIVLLSDGDPSVGEVVDPYEIRERVKQWNEHRGVAIHTIAFGGRFPILEWLAEDSGGQHGRFD